jgi:hypothetical protein
MRAILLAGAAILVLSSSAYATEITLGDINPSPQTCSYTSPDPGAVCNNPLTFTNSGNSFVFTGSDGANTTALTYKAHTNTGFDGLTIPSNVLGESGIGENATGSGTACTDTDCEIAVGKQVTVHANNDKINDIVIGSVQSSEKFSLYTDGTLFGTFGAGATACSEFQSNADTCFFNFADATNVTVVDLLGTDSTSADVTIVAISDDDAKCTNCGKVPEPSSLTIFGTVLFGLASLCWWRRA